MTAVHAQLGAETVRVTFPQFLDVHHGDLAQVQLGPDYRSGAIDLNGMEAVGGIVVMRFGENPRAVIERVREKIEQIEPGLEGVKIVPV